MATKILLSKLFSITSTPLPKDVILVVFCLYSLSYLSTHISAIFLSSDQMLHFAISSTFQKNTQYCLSGFCLTPYSTLSFSIFLFFFTWYFVIPHLHSPGFYLFRLESHNNQNHMKGQGKDCNFHFIHEEKEPWRGHEQHFSNINKVLVLYLNHFWTPALFKAYFWEPVLSQD